MRRDCDRLWEIDALREGRLGAKDVESFDRHQRSCATCSERMACDERLRRLGSAWPVEGPSELAVRRLRTRVMRDVATGAAPSGGSRRAHVVAGGLVAAACAAIAVGFFHGRAARSTAASAGPVAAVGEAHASAAAPNGPATPLAGSVRALGDAAWTQQREGAVELVRLDRGTVGVHVRPQHLGERFLVEMPDGEIEVRGTTFDVTVEAGATTRVNVEEGTVELRLRTSPMFRLKAGESWTASTPRAADVAPAQPPAGPASGAAAAAKPDDGSAAYADAMELLRRGRDDDAAAGFHAFVLAHPRASQAEDASFLEAVALARTGRADAAALAAEHHLARFPRSFHAKEAAVLIARAASDRGDCAKARAALAPWLASGDDAETRSALRACETASAPGR